MSSQLSLHVSFGHPLFRRLCFIGPFVQASYFAAARVMKSAALVSALLVVLLHLLVQAMPRRPIDEGLDPLSSEEYSEPSDAEWLPGDGDEVRSIHALYLCRSTPALACSVPAPSFAA